VEFGFLTVRQMLSGVSIRDIVLIDNLDLEFQPGLCVLTGETGAGKSILLDALGLCLGNRAATNLVREGAERGQASAIFGLPADHPVRGLLAEQSIPVVDDEIVVRRVVSADGRSRAYINDQPVSAGLLRNVGDALVELQGQHDQAAMFDAANHRAVLDAFGDLSDRVEAIGALHDSWRDASRKLADAEADVSRARADEDYLRHVVGELDALAPIPGEEESLMAERSVLANAEKLAAALEEAITALSSDGGAQVMLRRAERALERVADKASGRFDGALAAIGRAAIEAADALDAAEAGARDLSDDPRRLENLEERLHAMRALARKHGTAVDDLSRVRERLAEKLETLDGGDARLAALRAEAAGLEQAVRKEAAELHAARCKAATALDVAVNRELAALKLENARFETSVSERPNGQMLRDGGDQVVFKVTTNPGQPSGPLSKIASGGELSRFMLAIKVALAETRGPVTLIFDEVDRGVGGATADAVGARLERLAADAQVLVITHSPQVAARGRHHWRVAKRTFGGRVVTDVEKLDAEARREEIARMLAGARITEEARAAASSLMVGKAQ
jgi:DNA repair protein RecN (Recombination protein N)